MKFKDIKEQSKKAYILVADAILYGTAIFCVTMMIIEILN